MAIVNVHGIGTTEHWNVSQRVNSQKRFLIAREIDKITAILKNLNPDTPHLANIRLGLESQLGEFGDFLLDTDIRYAEVVE